MKALLSPRELAQAIGVSESSLKRWADAGQIRVTRTAGGHRRIPIAEAMRFIRDSRAPLVRPELLGLPQAGPTPPSAPPVENAADDLERLFLQGRRARAAGMLQALHLAGHSVDELADGPLAAALAHIAELARRGPSGLYLERRALDLALQAVRQLRALLAEPPDDAPLALGCAPAGDHHVLPSLLAATVIEAEGLHAMNLGPDLPVAALREAVTANRPALVWLSLTTQRAAEAEAAHLTALARELRGAGPRVVVLGAARRVLAGAPVSVLATLSELAGFAHRLQA